MQTGVFKVPYSDNLKALEVKKGEKKHKKKGKK